MFGYEQLRRLNNLLEDRIQGHTNNLNTIWNAMAELTKKIDNLYKKDHQDTVRPRADIVNDRLEEVERNLWDVISELQNRIRKLEEKKK